MAYVEVGESTIFQSTFVNQSNGNPTLSQDQLTHIMASILYMKHELLVAANHITMINLGCDCGVCFLNTCEARIVGKKMVVDQKITSSN